MVSVNNKPITWRVQWKFPRMKPETATYVAGNLYDLMQMLNRTENVNRMTVDHLYVHQVMPDGVSVIEHVAIDRQSQREQAKDSSTILTSIEGLISDARAIANVSSSSDKVQTKYRPGKVTAGYNCVAYPAASIPRSPA